MEEHKVGDLAEEGGARPILNPNEHPHPQDLNGGWPILTEEQLLNGGS